MDLLFSKMPPPGRRRQSRRETDDLVQLSLFDGFVGAVEDVLHGGVQILLAHAVQGASEVQIWLMVVSAVPTIFSDRTLRVGSNQAALNCSAGMLSVAA